MNQEGQTDPADLPPAATTAEAGREFDLDTQAAHAIAPDAEIIDVVANSNSSANFRQAVATALTFHPTVISISDGGTETGPATLGPS